MNNSFQPLRFASQILSESFLFKLIMSVQTGKSAHSLSLRLQSDAQLYEVAAVNLWHSSSLKTLHLSYFLYRKIAGFTALINVWIKTANISVHFYQIVPAAI